jgi:hypothetical protein
LSEHRELFRRIVLQVVQHCPKCHRPFEESHVQVLGQMGETWLFSLHCQHCHTLAVVGLALSTGEESPVAEGAPLTPDDLQEMHLFLEDFDGDFRSLFGELNLPESSEEPPRSP